MRKAYLFYNPLAGGGRILEDLEALEFVLDEECVFCDMTKPETYEQTLFAMQKEDLLVLCGGDGTVSCFSNLIKDLNLESQIYYYPAGWHNDFARDFGKYDGCNPFCIHSALRDLPQVQLGNRTTSFLTGVLFQENRKIRRTSRKAVGYTEQNTPRQVCVTVDGARQCYENVHFAAVMYGRYCNGGMIPDPDRRRTDEDLSCVLIHSCGKLMGKYLIHQLQKGRCVHSRYYTRIRGSRIHLSFDQPVCVLCDGEKQAGITALDASSGRKGEREV